MTRFRVSLVASTLLLSGLGPARAWALDAPGPAEPAPTLGKPSVRLDALDLSQSPLAAAREKAIRDLLAHEVRRADWGAGRAARIEYRFRVDELVTELVGGVLRVRCTATGFLPRGKSARSHLTFGGAPTERDQLVDHVLTIVTRGVITRLADLERRRRGYKGNP